MNESYSLYVKRKILRIFPDALYLVMLFFAVTLYPAVKDLHRSLIPKEPEVLGAARTDCTSKISDPNAIIKSNTIDTNGNSTIVYEVGTEQFVEIYDKGCLQLFKK